MSAEVRKGQSSPDNRNGGYFELGVGLSSYTSPILGMPRGNSQGKTYTDFSWDLSARYQYHCIFGEVFSNSFDQFTLGCNFFSDDNFSIDWVGLVQHSEMNEKWTEDYRGLNRRRVDFMSGPRITAYLFGHYILQGHALADISNTHHGELFSLKLARHWQIRNWTFHGIFGATYRSRQIADYYFSIDKSEASDRFPVYEAEAGMVYIAELGATYPLAEQWVFRSFVRRMDIDSKTVNSPLILDDHGEVIATSLSYVF